MGVPWIPPLRESVGWQLGGMTADIDRFPGRALLWLRSVLSIILGLCLTLPFSTCLHYACFLVLL